VWAPNQTRRPIKPQKSLVDICLAGWSSVNTLHSHSQSTRFDSRGLTPAEVFCDFPQSIQENFRIVPRLGHNRFLPHPFQFIDQSTLTLTLTPLQLQIPFLCFATSFCMFQLPLYLLPPLFPFISHIALPSRDPCISVSHRLPFSPHFSFLLYLASLYYIHIALVSLYRVGVSICRRFGGRYCLHFQVRSRMNQC
jgi:hypothetical protein